MVASRHRNDLYTQPTAGFVCVMVIDTNGRQRLCPEHSSDGWRGAMPPLGVAPCGCRRCGAALGVPSGAPPAGAPPRRCGRIRCPTTLW